MPNQWKKTPQPSDGAAASAATGLSRLVSGLRHEGGGSSLVVQTGFPTSLADLVFKNRNRLKKPSRRKKRSSDPESSTGDVDAASPASDIGTSPSIRENHRCRHLHPVVPESSTPRGAECVRRLASADAGARKRTCLGFWFAFFLVNMFVFVVPATGRRKLAAGITLAALGLRLLDTIGVRMFGFLKSCDNTTRSLELVSVGKGLETRALVSPIREPENEGLLSPIRKIGNEKRNFSCSIVASERSKGSPDLADASERSKISNLIGTLELSKSCPDLLMRSDQRDVNSISLNQKIKLSPKRRDLGVLAKVPLSRISGSWSNSKAKKLFRKFLPRKFRRKSNENDATAVSLDLDCGEISNSIIEHEEEVIEEDEIRESNVADVIRFNASDCVSNCDVENMDVVEERVPGAKCIRFQHLICFTFILLGLLGGKALSLVLTVFCLLFGKSIESLWKKKTDSVV